MTAIAYLKAIESDPNNIKPYMVMAGFYNFIGNQTKTLSMYQKALELQPKDIRIMDSIAKFYVKNKNIKDAEKYITKILDQNPKYFPSRMLKGELFILKHQFDEAIVIFNQLIKEKPRSGRAYYYKGVAHLGRGETGMAKSALGKALDLDQKFEEADEARKILSKL